MGATSSRQRRHPTHPPPPPHQHQQGNFQSQANSQAGFNSGGPQQVIHYQQSQGPPPYHNGQYYGGFRQPQVPYPYQNPQRYGQQPHYPGGPNMPVQYGQYGQQGQYRQMVTQEYAQTSSIKNQVNLKKHTLKVAPIAGQPKKLSIQFSFDASAPCRASTYVLATEISRKACQLVPREPDSRVAARFEKGLELKFPVDERQAAAHSIDLEKCKPEELAREHEDTFPLVIRLETLAQDAGSNGHSLDEIAAGSSLPLWVQSQTTYARVQLDEDGSWEVKVIKQKIWVKGMSYELQEIYGMEQNRSMVEDVDGRTCVICMSAERDTTVWPCRHMCMCHDCAAALKTQTSKCPICRNEIESLLHIHMPPKVPA